MSMKVTLENGAVLELGAECEFSDDGNEWHKRKLQMVDFADTNFKDDAGDWWNYCRPIRKSELKEVPMSAIEVAEIVEKNWVYDNDAKQYYRHLALSVDSVGTITLGLSDIAEYLYAPTPDAPESEWKRFVKMVEVEG